MVDNKSFISFFRSDISLFSRTLIIRSFRLLCNKVFLHVYIDPVVCSGVTSKSAAWGGAKARASFGRFVHSYELMLGLHVFRQTGPPRRVDCLAPPSVCHIKTEASR